MRVHSSYKFSITIKTLDLAVVHCLRALAQHNQKTGNSRIPWGGTKESDWLRSKHCITLHFDRPVYRLSFQNDVARLLPRDKWAIIGQSENDPAVKQ